MVERTLGAGVVHVNEVIDVHMPSEAPDTLASIINGVKLKKEEQRSVFAADAMRIPLEQKGVLVGADIFFRDGIFRVSDVLGFDRDQAVAARDAVRAETVFEARFAQFNLLRKPGFAEVEIDRKAGISVEETARKLKLRVEEVERIVVVLDDYGFSGDKSVVEVLAAHVRWQVTEGDHERQKFGLAPLSRFELGRRLGRSMPVIDRARAVNRSLGLSSTLGEEGIAKRRDAVRTAIISSPTLTDEQILASLKTNGEESVTIAIIKHRRLDLIQEGLVEPKKRLTRGAPLKSRSERAEALLRDALREYLDSGRKLVIKDLKELPGLRDVPISTITYYIDRIEQSGAEMPEFKFRRR